MGSVFEAEDTQLGHRVALKLLHPHVAQRKGAGERFVREGRAAARIRHPNVVQVLALGIEGDTPYLAMELLEGDDLSQRITRAGRLSVEETLDVVLPVVAAVAAAHDAGVIHRDLKPSNVCITRGPGGHSWPKVVDFGVSKVISGDASHLVTVTDAVVGTAAYMAPEQARSSNDASFRSDQYSLAVLVYQCVTGTLPFTGRGVYEIVEAIMTAPLAPPSTRASAIPDALDAIVLRAMSRVPSERYASVRAFGEALLPLASERTRLAFAYELSTASDFDSIGSGSALATDLAHARPAAGPHRETTMPRTGESNALGARAARIGRRVSFGIPLVATSLVLAIIGLHHRAPVQLPPVASEPLAALSSAPMPAASSGPPVVVTVAAVNDPTGPPSPSIVARPRSAPPLRRPRPAPPPPITLVRSGPIVLGDNGAPILP